MYETNVFSTLLVNLNENIAKLMVFDATPIETLQNKWCLMPPL